MLTSNVKHAAAGRVAALAVGAVLAMFCAGPAVAQGSSGPASAQGGQAAVVETGQRATGSLTLSFRDGDTAVVGGSVALYRVAELTGDLTYRLTGGFEGSGVDVSDPAATELPAALAAVIPTDVAPRTVEVALDGTAKFDDLPLGLYLVVQTQPAQGYRTFSPFVVCVPTEYEEGWEYDVDASPKMEPDRSVCPEAPVVPDLPKTADEALPAGAVGLLSAGGCVLCLAGAALLARRRED